MILCEGRVQLYDAQGPILDCLREVAGLYQAACVHEHVATRWLCAAHRDRKPLLCWICYEIDGHHCVMGPVSEVLPRPVAG